MIQSYTHTHTRYYPVLVCHVTHSVHHLAYPLSTLQFSTLSVTSTCILLFFLSHASQEPFSLMKHDYLKLTCFSSLSLTSL